MGVRALLDRTGPFDETLVNGRDEEELPAGSAEATSVEGCAAAAVDLW